VQNRKLQNSVIGRISPTCFCVLVPVFSGTKTKKRAHVAAYQIAFDFQRVRKISDRTDYEASGEEKQQKLLMLLYPHPSISTPRAETNTWWHGFEVGITIITNITKSQMINFTDKQKLMVLPTW